MDDRRWTIDHRQSSVAHGLWFLFLLLSLACATLVPGANPAGLTTRIPLATSTEHNQQATATPAPPSSPSPLSGPTRTTTPIEPQPSPTAGTTAAEGLPSIPDQPPDYTAAMRPQFRDDPATLTGASQYEIQAAIDPDHLQVQGHETVRYTNTETATLNTIYFRLFPNAPGYGGEMSVSNLTVSGAAVDPTYESSRTAIRVPLVTTLAPRQSVTVTLDFQLVVPGSADSGYAQLGYVEDVLALANFYPIIPAYDDTGWHKELGPPYGDAVYSDTALYRVTLAAPTGWVVVGSGSTVEHYPDENRREIWTLVSGPMRDFNLVLSPKYAVTQRTIDEIQVNAYYLPGIQAAADRLLDWMANAIPYFDRTFGPYPFREFDISPTGTRAGGIEYPGLIVLPASNYDSQNAFFEFAAVHELAHQWWYSVVGDDQVNHPWLDESLTQYSTYLYYEHTYGSAQANQIAEQDFEQRYDRARQAGEDLPAGLPVAAYSESQYSEIVYGKGPLFFRDLRQEVGDTAFFKLLATYFQQYRYQVATPEDFQRVAEQVSGRSIGSLFQKWIGGVR